VTQAHDPSAPATPAPRRQLPDALDQRLRQLGTVLRGLEDRWWQVMRALFIRRVLVHAALVGARVELEVAYDARIHPTTRVRIEPGSTTRVHLGARTLLRRDVTLLLQGGDLEVHPDCEFRERCALGIRGRLEVGRGAIFGIGVHLHAANRIVLGEWVGCSEHVVITDSSHHHTSPDEWFYEQVTKGTARVGRNTWIAAHAVVTRDSDVGDHCIVAANAVVVGEIPDNHFAAGAPARARPLQHPWLDDADAAIGADDTDADDADADDAGDAS